MGNLPSGAAPRLVRTEHRLDDQLFRNGVRAVAGGSFLLLVLIGLFLFLKALPVFRREGFWHFLTSTGFQPIGPHPSVGVAALLFWTVVIAVIAIVIAVPVSVGTAVFITEYAPPGLRRVLTSLIDLLAVVPAVIFGLWGFYMLQPNMAGFAAFLSAHLSFIPIFQTSSSIFKASAFIAGVLVGLMVVPVITSIAREIFSLTPQGEREAALSLGASKAAVVRRVVLPFAREGLVGAVMLGLGRAMGETIAVALIVSPIFTISPRILQAGANPIAPFIATHFGFGGKLGLAGLVGAGFVLFCFTLVVNLAASAVVNRSRTRSVAS